MNFMELLEVNRDRLPKRTQEAVNYMERRWLEAGSPSEAKGLTEFLDRALKFCTEVEFHYPRVFLLRLKQLQRG